MKKYKGYKGTIIVVVGTATDWRDNEKIIIYKKENDSEWFSMPERIFNGDVEDETTHEVLKRWTLINEQESKIAHNSSEKNPESILKQYFGHDTFRGKQEDVVQSILSGRDTICVMPTGAGKSLCYQLPGMMLNGLTLVISPLIALMKDQVEYLNSRNIPAVYLNSTLSFKEQKIVNEELLAGKYKFLYVAPERLSSDAFQSLCNKLDIALLAIDEAHCISEWGNSFRPDYRKIGPFVPKLNKRPVVAAFTATATKKVKQDISTNLGLNNPFSITTGFDRPNLKYSVFFPKEKKRMLADILSGHNDESSIVYCLTKPDVEHVYDYLIEKGFSVLKYHAGLSNAERAANQEAFIEGRTKIIVATKAFGMGIDKADIRLVVNYNMPDSIEMYYQEAGRAGRDGNPADCILLYSPSDVVVNQQLMDKDDNLSHLNAEDRTIVRNGNEERLRQMTYYATCNDCLRRRILTYFGDPAELHCDNCSNCLGKYELVDITDDAKSIIECLRESGQRFGIDRIADTLKGANTKNVKDKRLDRLQTFGAIQGKDKVTICHEIRTLINDGFLRQEGEYNIIKICNLAADILNGNVQVTARAYDKLAVSRQNSSPQKKQVVSVSFNQQLYNELSEWRRGEAERQVLPPYCIFHNSTLQAVSAALPVTKAEILSIKGIGEDKFNKYGSAIIEIVKKYK